jgi:hypothetical protein
MPPFPGGYVITHLRRAKFWRLDARILFRTKTPQPRSAGQQNRVRGVPEQILYDRMWSVFNREDPDVRVHATTKGVVVEHFAEECQTLQPLTAGTFQAASLPGTGRSRHLPTLTLDQADQAEGDDQPDYSN